MNLSYTYKVKAPQDLMAWWMGGGVEGSRWLWLRPVCAVPLELHRRGEDAL